MLTLKAPVQLHIAQGLTGNAEAFSERIRGNYGLIGSHYTPKDLLFLLTAPPELPEELGGMTTLVTQNSNVDVRTVTMDVVNHVVNRILLDGTQQFTYQDQVYITSVLNRLGVTNVSQFMEQVRQLRTENESTVRLTQMYREKLAEIFRREQKGEQALSLPIPSRGDGEAAEISQDPRVTMCLDILQRLDTTNLFETVHKFQQNWTGGATNIHHNELRMAEQLRFSNAVALSEIKQQIYQQPQLHLLHHFNQYEAGLLMEAPRDEEAVLSQAAVAALVNAVDNTVVAVLNRPSLRQEQWVHIENAIWQTAENTLSRFETYHSQYSLPSRAQTPAAQAAWKYVEQELNEYQNFYQSVYPKAEQYGRNIFESYYGANVRMTHLEQLEEEEMRVQEEHRHFHIEHQTTALPPDPKPLEPVAMTLREVEEHAPEILVEELTRIDQQNRTMLQNIQQSIQRRETPAPQGADVRRTMQDALRALEEPGAVLQEIFTQQEAKLVHPDYSPQEEAILRQADPASRILYEKIFAYQKDPEGALLMR